MRIFKLAYGWAKSLVLTVTVSVTLLISLEIAARYLHDGTDFISMKKWMESKPKAFKDDKDFDIILDNYNGTCKRPTLIYEDGINYYGDDFSCGGISYINGKRSTLPTPNIWSRTMHVFGGSTVWGTGSVDALTIPSIMQTYFLENEIRVLNYGMSGLLAKQQNNLLFKSSDKINVGDIIVYYDGGNDFWNGVIYTNYDGDIRGYNLERKSDLYLFILKNWLSQNLAIYDFLSAIKNNREKRQFCDLDLNHSRIHISVAAKKYSDRIQEARSFATKMGAQFFHFYQPTLFDSDHMTAYESEVLSRNPCWREAATLKEDFDHKFLSQSPASIDLSEKLVNKDVFYDFVHVSAAGNKIVSKEILHYIDATTKH